MEVMKKVLIISYYFPPAGGGGVQRTGRFARFLPAHGWKPVILTTTEESYIETDPGLLKELDEDLNIERINSILPKSSTGRIRRQTGTPLPWESPARPRTFISRILQFMRNWFMIPDSQIFWVISSAFRLRRIIKRHRPDVIFASAPPFSAFILGLLAKSLSGRKLVLDYRDPWTQWIDTYRSEEPPGRRWIEKKMEKMILERSDSAIVTTPPIKSYLQSMDDSGEESKYNLIYNGFDRNDFDGIKPEEFEKFTLVYTGKIDSRMYSAAPLVRALGKLLNRRPDIKEKISVRFLGTFDDREAERLIKELELEKNIILHGYVPHSRCVSYQLGADLLLLLRNRGVMTGLTISAKLFEYLGAGKPILALIPTDSLTANILEELNAGTVIDQRETGRIVSELEKSYQGEKIQSVDRENLQKFDRRVQAGQLADILDSLSPPSQ